MVFTSRVRTGHYGCQRVVQVQTLSVAIRAIGKTCELVRGYNPTYRGPRQYIDPLEMQLKGMRREDPIPIPELAVPVAVAWWIADYGRNTSCERQRAMGDLGLVVFYFLL